MCPKDVILTALSLEPDKKSQQAARNRRHDEKDGGAKCLCVISNGDAKEVGREEGVSTAKRAPCHHHLKV